MNPNKLACACNTVTYQQIIDAVRGGARTFEEVQAETHCGLGCGRCVAFLRAYVQELVEDGVPEE